MAVSRVVRISLDLVRRLRLVLPGVRPRLLVLVVVLGTAARFSLYRVLVVGVMVVVVRGKMGGCWGEIVVGVIVLDLMDNGCNGCCRRNRMCYMIVAMRRRGHVGWSHVGWGHVV